jgi:hypothetical protein
MSDKPRHSYFSARGPHAPSKMMERTEAAFENAMIDIANAEDGNGNRVRLISVVGVPTAQQLKEETFRFMENFDIDAMYIKPDASGKLVESADVETAVWANLALLARATAAAIRLEAARTRR